MSPRWFMGFVTLFVLCTIMFNFLESPGGDWLTSDDVESISVLGQTELTSRQHSEGAVSNFLEIPSEWFGTAYRMLSWDYMTLSGEWVVFKYIIFWPISVGMFITLALLFRRIIAG